MIFQANLFTGNTFEITIPKKKSRLKRGATVFRVQLFLGRSITLVALASKIKIS